MRMGLGDEDNVALRSDARVLHRLPHVTPDTPWREGRIRP